MHLSYGKLIYDDEYFANDGIRQAIFN